MERCCVVNAWQCVTHRLIHWTCEQSLNTSKVILHAELHTCSIWSTHSRSSRLVLKVHLLNHLLKPEEEKKQSSCRSSWLESVKVTPVAWLLPSEQLFRLQLSLPFLSIFKFWRSECDFFLINWRMTCFFMGWNNSPASHSQIPTTGCLFKRQSTSGR